MLNEYARSFLSEFGDLPQDMILDPERVRFRYWDWDRQILKPTRLEFLNVDRALFDEWLVSLLPDNVEIAPKCTCTEFEQTEEGVTVEMSGSDTVSTVHCDYLVGADGARSRVRRGLGIGTVATYITLQDFVELQDPLEPWFDCIYMRDIGDSFGYAYVMPKGETAIVGSVFYPRTKRPHERQEQVLELLGERLPQLRGPSRKREASVALCVRKMDDVVPGCGRVLLAGEAGGFMSPSSGEGISYALNTGSAAGSAIATASNGGALTAYRERTSPIYANIQRKLRWLPLMESRVGKYLAGFVPATIVSKITEGL